MSEVVRDFSQPSDDDLYLAFCFRNHSWVEKLKILLANPPKQLSNLSEIDRINVINNWIHPTLVSIDFILRGDDLLGIKNQIFIPINNRVGIIGKGVKDCDDFQECVASITTLANDVIKRVEGVCVMD